MSAMGQKRTLLVSFDHFVGGDEQARRYCKTKCFRRLEIDDSFVLGWHLHRKIGRLGAAQNSIDIPGRRPEHIGSIYGVTHQPTGLDEETVRVNRGQAVPGRKRDEQVAVSVGVYIWWQKQAAVRRARKRLEHSLNLGRLIPDRSKGKLNAE